MERTMKIRSAGDVRYVPTSTWNLVNDYKWGSNGYTASFRITKAGNYTLKVTFMKQMYDGSQWVDTGETSVSTQDFTIAGEGSLLMRTEMVQEIPRIRMKSSAAV